MQLQQTHRVIGETGVRVVEHQIENGLRVVSAGLEEFLLGQLAAPHQFTACPVVEWIGLQHIAEDGHRFGLVLVAQDGGQQHLRLVMIAVLRDRLGEPVHRAFEVAAAAVDAGELIESGAPPCVVPGGLGEIRIGFVEMTREEQGEPEVVVSLAGFRIRVAEGQPVNRLAEVGIRLVKEPITQLAAADGDVAAGVAGIAPERFPPVKLR